MRTSITTPDAHGGRAQIILASSVGTTMECPTRGNSTGFCASRISWTSTSLTFYTDGPLPFEGYGYSAVANLYNQSAKRSGGKVEAVYTSKQPEDCAVGTCVLDFERGLANQIRPAAWQTDTCLGNWHYDVNVFRDHKY